MDIVEAKQILNCVVECDKRFKRCSGVCKQCKWDFNRQDACVAAKVVLEELRKHTKAYWKYTEKGNEFTCSNCNITLENVPTFMDRPAYRYCPCCGAEMEG